MDYARAVVAGVFAATLALLLVRGFGEDTERVDAITVLLLLATIALLIVPDAVEQWRRFRHRE